MFAFSQYSILVVSSCAMMAADEAKQPPPKPLPQNNANPTGIAAGLNMLRRNLTLAGTDAVKLASWLPIPSDDSTCAFRNTIHGPLFINDIIIAPPSAESNPSIDLNDPFLAGLLVQK
jgi:hypothetical protein